METKRHDANCASDCPWCAPLRVSQQIVIHGANIQSREDLEEAMEETGRVIVQAEVTPIRNSSKTMTLRQELVVLSARNVPTDAEETILYEKLRDLLHETGPAEPYLTARFDPLSNCGHQTREIAGWVESTWGSGILNSVEERVSRILEEACELAQAEDISFEKCVRILLRTYERPKGDPILEGAGVGITLHAWAACHRLNLERLIARGYQTASLTPRDNLRQKQQAKALAGTGRMPE